MEAIAACLALGAASLVLPSEPSYDPLAWLIWGRELAHLRLDTSGGPSWKPLPVVFTTLFAPFGELDRGSAAAIWMALARAGSRWRWPSPSGWRTGSAAAARPGPLAASSPRSCCP